MMELLNNIKDYYNIIITIVSIVIALVAVAYKIKSNFIAQISKFINDAQDLELTGPEKMEYVISWIKDIIPRLFKVIFNDKTLNQIAQNIYNDMKEYAKKRNEELEERKNQSNNTENPAKENKSNIRIMSMKELLDQKENKNKDTKEQE